MDTRSEILFFEKPRSASAKLHASMITSDASEEKNS